MSKHAESSYEPELRASEENEGWWEKLGCQRVAKLDEDICWRRAHYLKRGLRIGKWNHDERLRNVAQRKAYWMEYLAKRGGDQKTARRRTQRANESRSD